MSVQTYKYPRTPHHPTLSSKSSVTSDDRIASAETLAYLQSGIELVTSSKLDGGNVSLYRGAFHGRSLDSGVHPWDTFAKQIHARIEYDIPEGWRISCESMYAQRSVRYEELESVLYIIGIWDETRTLLDWDATEEWAELFGLPTVPVLYRGTDYNEAISAWGKVLNDDISEGFVVRDAGRIAFDDFEYKCFKRVRSNHVRTPAAWRHRNDFSHNGFVEGAL